MRHTRLVPCLAGICVGRQRLGFWSAGHLSHTGDPLPRLLTFPVIGQGAVLASPVWLLLGHVKDMQGRPFCAGWPLGGKRAHVQLVRKQGVHWLKPCPAVLVTAVDGARP